MDKSKIRVVIVDDNAMLRSAWEQLLHQQPDIACVGALESADRLMASVEALRPDVVLLDLTMPGVHPLDALRATSALHPQTRFLVYSGWSDPALLQSAINAGASRCIDKATPPPRILEAIRDVAGSHGKAMDAPPPRTSPR